MAFNNAESTESSKSGPDVAKLNAPLPPQPRATKVGQGAEGREAGEGAGIESGLYLKQAFDNNPRVPQDGLGKPIAPMGTPPWDDPLTQMVGGSVKDTFGAGERHEIKNG